jgi:hypothetical protein
VATPTDLLIFNQQDISEAIDRTNFEKGMGNDEFDGKVLLINKELRTKVEKEIAQMLNEGKIPEYLKEGRMIPLSKKKGEDTVRLDEIRPIIVKSHITKIMEKAIEQKLEERKHLVKSGRYQTGFKGGLSTSLNLAEILNRIAKARR